MKRIVAAIAMVVVLVPFGGANAAAQVIVSGPGAAATGAYDGVDVAVTAAGSVTYVNADPLAPHNVVSVAKKNPSCNTNCTPLFRSGDTVNAGGVQEFSIDGIPAGDYEFYCTAHPTMRGTLTIVA